MESFSGERRVAGAPSPEGCCEAEQGQGETHSEVEGRSSEEGYAASAEARAIGAPSNNGMNLTKSAPV
jgi:hypothetical protein